MTAKQSIAWLQAAWKDDKKRINLLLVSGLAGMLLLCMSEWLPAGQSTQNAAQSSQQSQTAAEYEQQLETRLAALIRAMDGAGETVVMVTLDCGMLKGASVTDTPLTSTRLNTFAPMTLPSDSAP